MTTALDTVEPKWLTLARAEIGTKEAPGDADNPAVVRYFAEAGHPEIRHDSVSWCAGFQCAMLERAGETSPRDLSARSFLKWGRPSELRVGAIAVLWREDPRSWKGHVGAVARWNDTHICLLAGNQHDSVCEVWFPREQVLGYRWPKAVGDSRTATAAKVSAGSGGVGAAAQAAEKLVPPPDVLAQMADAGAAFAGALEGAAHVLPAISLVAALISIAAAGVAFWARLDDLKNTGR